LPAVAGGTGANSSEAVKTGERHRNTEFSTVRDGQLAETQVFFGGRYQ
jgi:hypothetical protein